MICLTEQQKQDIGLRFVFDSLELRTPYGAELAARLRPFAAHEQDRLTDELDNLGRVKKVYTALPDAFAQVFQILSTFKDIRPAIAKCRNDGEYVLDEVELFTIKNYLLSLGELAGALDGLRKDMPLSCLLPQPMPGPLALLDPDGGGLRSFYIHDTASPKLLELRAEKRRLEAAITATTDEAQKRLLREERLSIVGGEEDEELRLRMELTAGLRAHAEDFLSNADAVGRLDLLLQKGRLAAENQTARPAFSEGAVSFENVYNPHIAQLLKKRGKVFTPVSVTLRRGTAVLTGANMGGKSVALKTLTLNIVLFQLGFFVFADQAALPMFDCVHMISEDLQSLDTGLSTFAAEIVKLQQIVNDLGRGFSFIALDEFARGTNPREGAGLARAVARYLNTKNAVSILTTHYDNVSLPEFTNYRVIGLGNLDPELLRQKLLLTGAKSFALIAEYMDYRLQEVTPDDSAPPRDAVHICRMLNLSEEILGYYE